MYTIDHNTQCAAICNSRRSLWALCLERASDGPFTHGTAVTEEYHIRNRLVGQTYDGASVISGHLHGLQTNVSESTYYYAHVLKCCYNKACQTLKEFKYFLVGSKHFSKSFRSLASEEFVQEKLPSDAPTRWKFSPRLVHTVNECCRSLTDKYLGFSYKEREKYYRHWGAKTRLMKKWLNDFCVNSED